MSKQRKLKNPERTAWDWCSRWIRLRDADDNGFVKCVTCPAIKYWKELQAGHYVPQGSANILKFEPDNIHPQCDECNRHLHGNLAEYTLYMIGRYGLERTRRLVDKKHKTIKRHELEYYAMIEHFKNLAKEAAKERGLKI